MASRSLARTIIEGGRASYSKFGRNQQARAGRRLKFDVEGEPFPTPYEPNGVRHSDKLNPMYRWLQAHAGQQWSEVYAEFCAKVDRRSLRGWHAHDHLIGYVYGAGGREGSPGFAPFFFVDDAGVLRETERDSRRYVRDPREDEVNAWLNKRRLWPTEDGHLRWARRLYRKRAEWEPIQRDQTGRTLPLIAYWGMGSRLDDREIGTLTSYPKTMWKHAILAKWLDL